MAPYIALILLNVIAVCTFGYLVGFIMLFIPRWRRRGWKIFIGSIVIFIGALALSNNLSNSVAPKSDTGVPGPKSADTLLDLQQESLGNRDRQRKATDPLPNLVTIILSLIIATGTIGLFIALTRFQSFLNRMANRITRFCKPLSTREKLNPISGENSTQAIFSPLTDAQMSQIDGLIDEILEKTMRPAIALKRSCSTMSGRPGGSTLGGLPRLPKQYDWPMGFAKYRRFPGPQNVPMHFLAQIDCSELPPIYPEMPDCGVLFFFALIDEAVDWDDNDPVSNYAAVIYAPSAPADTPVRTPPSDMIPIGDAQQWGMSVSHLWTDDDDPSVYPQWPVTPISFMSYPIAAQIRDLRQRSYDIGFNPMDFRQMELEEIYGRKRGKLQKASLDEFFFGDGETRTRTVDYLNTECGVLLFEEDVFPAFGALLHDVASAIGHAAGAKQYELKRRGDRSPDNMSVGLMQEQADLKNKERVARLWMSEAKKIGLSNPVGLDDKRRFQKWIRDELGPQEEWSDDYSWVFPKAMRRTMQRAAVHPELWKLIDRRYLEHMYEDHEPYAEYHHKIGEFASIEQKNHQMGGYFQSSQKPLAHDDSRIPLLHLGSDRGMNFMFGDVGELQFFIEPGDLEKRDFSRVSVILNGH